MEIIKTDDPDIVIRRETLDSSINIADLKEERIMLLASIDSLYLQKQAYIDTEVPDILVDMVNEKIREKEEIIAISETRIQEIEFILQKCCNGDNN